MEILPLARGKLMSEENRKITVYSYSKAWNVEKKIYNIGNLMLPVPVEMWSMIYYAGAVMLVLVLQRLLPAISAMPVVLRFGMLPYGIVYVMRKTKLDGKNPLKYFAQYLIYLFRDRHSYLEHFTRHEIRKEMLLLHWLCSQAYCKPVRPKKSKRKIKRKDKKNV